MGEHAYALDNPMEDSSTIRTTSSDFRTNCCKLNRFEVLWPFNETQALGFLPQGMRYSQARFDWIGPVHLRSAEANRSVSAEFESFSLYLRLEQFFWWLFFVQCESGQEVE